MKVIEVVKCLRCKETWFPSKPLPWLPKTCAKCNTIFWNTPRKYKKQKGKK